jgi:hypothetical protein
MKFMSRLAIDVTTPTSPVNDYLRSRRSQFKRRFNKHLLRIRDDAELQSVFLAELLVLRNGKSVPIGSPRFI